MRQTWLLQKNRSGNPPLAGSRLAVGTANSAASRSPRALWAASRKDSKALSRSIRRSTSNTLSLPYICAHATCNSGASFDQELAPYALHDALRSCDHLDSEPDRDSDCHAGGRKVAGTTTGDSKFLTM